MDMEVMAMPIYIFRCKNCAHQFEQLTSISKRDAVRCPKCGQEVARVYEGQCAYGGKRGAEGGCSGSCACCSGCHHG